MVLNQDEIDGCRDAFLAFDKDRSGTVARDEIVHALKMWNIPLADESLDSYFRMAGALRPELKHALELIESPRIIYAEELGALLR